MDVPKRAIDNVVDDPVVYVAPDVLARYNARILDPATAVRVAGQPELRSTVYLSDKLLVSGVASADTRTALTAAAAELGLAIQPPLERSTLRERRIGVARGAGIVDPELSFPILHHLEPVDGAAVVPDAWTVLQAFRAKVGRSNVGQQHVGLDHLLTATKMVHPGPFDPTAVVTARSSYGLPGFGGRQPVNWLGGEPQRRADLKCRRPVVAVLDTGVGEHDWLPLGANSCVHRNPSFGGMPLGLPDPGEADESGVVSDPLEGVLDPYSGHGTFIAGLIRQQCPDADIVSIRVMPSEGAVPEHVLHDALTGLAHRQAAAQAQGLTDQVVDVVSLSLGYYPESVDLATAHPFLFDPIEALGRCGVVVVVSAGNDATRRPMYPAAFTPYPGGLVSTPPDPNCVPVLSVAAANPDGSVALFSNDGPWVLCAEPGAALVSTFPKFDASAQPGYRVRTADGWRATLDPDNFASGFGVWSGTSFAAPVLAGKIAQSLVDGACGDIDPVDQPATRDRGWRAVAQHSPLARP